MKKIVSLFSFVLAMAFVVSVFGATNVAYAKNDKKNNDNGYEERANDKNKNNKCSGWNWFKKNRECNPNADKPPVVYIFASKYSIKAGKSTELYLKTKNQIDSCTASGGWSGTKSKDVREEVSPLVTTTYTITCTNPWGTYSDSVEIWVKGGATTTPPATTTPTATLNFSGNPLNITDAQDSTLTWDSTNATHCLASGSWSGSKSLDGNQVVSPNATSTYTLACGNSSGTSTKSVTINVTPTSTPVAPTLNFVADPLSILSGSSTSLTWSSANTNFCLASNAWTGSKSLSGSLSVSPSATSTYTLACGGLAGTTTQSVTVDVVPTSTPVQNLDHVVISEVYFDVASTTLADDPGNEWIELYNGTGASVDVGGWFVHDSGASGVDTIPLGTTISSGGFLLLTGSSTTGTFWPGKTFVVLPSLIGSGGLSNTGDGIVINNQASTTIDAMSYGSNTSVFSLPLSGGTDGQSLRRINLTTDTGTASDWEKILIPTPGNF